MKNALIITCYIGKLPDGIGLWLKSCENNPEYDFMLVTDQRLDIKIPENVIVLRQNLQQLKERFQKCLNFKICLESPYKLCDYRPLYGLAFAEYLQNYRFWGHCDLDMVFGRISHFFTNEILDSYDRLGSFGALILYRNSDRINHLYKEKGSAFSYKKIWTSPYNYGFDERYGYNLICKNQGIRWLDCGHKFIADRNLRDYLDLAGIKNYERQRILWHDGAIFHIYIDENGQLKKDEKLYYHFTKTDYVVDEVSENVIFDANECENIKLCSIDKYMSEIEPNSINNLKVAKDKVNIRKATFMRMSIAKKYIYIRQKAVWMLKR